MPPVAFTSWLAPHLRAFVALKRAGGCNYQSQERLLLMFDRHVHREVRPPLSRTDLLAYVEAKSHLAPRSRDNVVAAIWPAPFAGRRSSRRSEWELRSLQGMNCWVTSATRTL